MVRFWLMDPERLYESERIKEIERMDLFGMPISIDMNLKLSGKDFDSIKDAYSSLENGFHAEEKKGLLSYQEGKIPVPLGKKIYLFNMEDNLAGTALATISSAAAFRLKDANNKEAVQAGFNGKEELLSLTRAGFIKRIDYYKYISLDLESVVSYYTISDLNLRPSDKELREVLDACCKCNLERSSNRY